MCNLYTARKSAAEIARLFNAEVAPDVTWKDEFYPKAQAPVILERDGRRVLELMTWGFPTQRKRKTAPREGQSPFVTDYWTNARNLDNAMWKYWLDQPPHRCLVPFTRFAEPKLGKDPATGRPAQHWFTIADQELPAFAGIWRPTDSGPHFAFVTTDPNPLVAPLHPKAMPVILLAEDHDRWLHGTPEEVRALQAPYPSQMMELA